MAANCFGKKIKKIHPATCGNFQPIYLKEVKGHGALIRVTVAAWSGPPTQEYSSVMEGYYDWTSKP